MVNRPAPCAGPIISGSCTWCGSPRSPRNARAAPACAAARDTGLVGFAPDECGAVGVDVATTWTFDPPAGKAIAITTPATTPRPNLVCLRRHHGRSALARAFAAYASAEATFSWSSISHPLVDHIILAPRC